MRYLVLLSLLFICSCKKKPIPKPRTFPKVEYPKQVYLTYEDIDCPFRFQKSSASIIQKKTSFFDEKPPNQCWFNLFYPSLNSTIYFSYYDILSDADINNLVQEGFKLAYEHSSRANFIEEQPIHSLNSSGFAFNLEGPSASPYQFYLTDSTKHFIRGALYFEAKTNRDSLDEIIDFMKEDIAKIIETFEWKY